MMVRCVLVTFLLHFRPQSRFCVVRSHLWRETEWREGRRGAESGEERGKGQFGVNFIVCHKRFVVVVVPGGFSGFCSTK